jgi:hypothetical protein
MDYQRKRSRSLVSEDSSDSAEDVTLLAAGSNAEAPVVNTAAERKIPGTKPYNKAFRPIYNSESASVIRCDLPPHKPIHFKTYEQWERHCHRMHSYRCSACGLNFPDEHILELHISEKHDPLEDARRSRGEKTVGISIILERMCAHS